MRYLGLLMLTFFMLLNLYQSTKHSNVKALWSAAIPLAELIVQRCCVFKTQDCGSLNNNIHL